MFYKPLMFLFLAAIVIALSIATLMFGKNVYSFNQLLSITPSNQNDYFILYNLRFPRLVINLYCGMLFALSGSIFQAIYKNPVASPDILGVNAMAIFTILIFSNLFGSQDNLFWYALIGVVSGFGLTLILAMKDKKIIAVRLIIVGLALSILFRAFSQLLVIQSHEALHNLLAFLNGTLSQTSWESVNAITYPTIILISICLLFARYLDVMLLNTSVAKALGMNVDCWRIFFLGFALLMSACAIRHCAKITFHNYTILGLII